MNNKTNIRCQILDSDGNRCKNIARYKHSYHGDPEIYTYHENSSEDMKWVEIFVCKKHQFSSDDSTAIKDTDVFVGAL